MSNTPQSKPGHRCEGLIIENGGFRRRWIDEITLHIDGKLPKTLKGDKLPQALVLNTGTSQESLTVLEFFYEKVPSVKVPATLPDDPQLGLNGREIGMFIVGGIAGAVALAAVIASFNSVSSAMPF